MENYILESINSALDFIEKNLDDDFSLEDIAEYSNFSLSYLYRLFNLIMGISIKEYIRKRRLSESIYDLTNSNMNILEIAIKYQYNTYESYSRAFKKEFGICPSEVRKKKIKLSLFEPIILKGGNIMENKNYLLLIDIDKFENINNNYGRDFGDYILETVHERIEKTLKEEKEVDFENKDKKYIERAGGDEFVIVIYNIEEEKAKKISEKILNSIRKPITFNQKTIQITASIGITEYAILNKNSYRNAYNAVIKAKKEGRNNYKIVK